VVPAVVKAALVVAVIKDVAAQVMGAAAKAVGRIAVSVAVRVVEIMVEIRTMGVPTPIRMGSIPRLMVGIPDGEIMTATVSQATVRTVVARMLMRDMDRVKVSEIRVDKLNMTPGRPSLRWKL
jgi:hypothetical protein